MAEDSPHAPAASNPRPADELRALREACRVLGDDRPVRSKINALLHLVRRACRAERAFLVEGAREGGQGARLFVRARDVRRDDGLMQPSATVALGALRRTSAFVCTDVDAEQPLAVAPSVKALDLRRVLAAPLPGISPGRRALLLDSRDGSSTTAAEEEVALVEAFAALLAALGPEKIDDTRCEAHAAPCDSGIVGRSPAIVAMLDWVRRAGRSHLPVLIGGETGSGKEGVARLIHEHSPRRGGPFVAFNCTALTESLVEAELFGSSRGAYTGSVRDRRGLFQLAHGGTLLLDEVGDMPAMMQGKILRALQENTIRPVGGETDVAVDVRIVAATHRDLERRVRDGLFRSDLYYRLSVIRVFVPPLRRRLADLPLLVRELAPRLERETGVRPLRLGRGALEHLRGHDWPGNVRELHAVLARALLKSGGEPIEDFHLGPLGNDAWEAGCGETNDPGLERRMIENVLRGNRNAIAAAAREIGWTRQKLYRRMNALGIRLDRPGSA